MTAVDPPRDLVRHLHERAGDYFEDLKGAPVEIRAGAVEVRHRSHLYRFRLSGRGQRHGIVVKAPNIRAATRDEELTTTSPARPRLVPRADIRMRYQAEYASLLKVEVEIAQRTADDRFGAVRALDFIPSRNALVMVEVREPTLRDLMTGYTRLHVHRRSADLGPVFEHSGAWLRLYHGLDAAEAAARHATRAAVFEFAEAVGDYLGTVQRDGTFFREAVEVVRRTGGEVLPAEMPLVVGHGDFASRNLFVGAGARVSVTDMSMRWRTAPYEDLAYFLVALRTSRPQALTDGRIFSQGSLVDWEQHLIAGYFPGETPPRTAISIYELLLLMDKWAGRPTSGTRHPWHRSRAEALLINRWYRKEAERLLASM